MKQNRRDYALAAVALTLAAGMLTATIFAAQPRTEDQPDAFELRRGLIDRIEAAYTNGDTATMERMNLCAALPEIPDPATALTLIAGIVAVAEPDARSNGPTGVAQSATEVCVCPAGSWYENGHCYVGYYVSLGPADCRPPGWPGPGKDPWEIPETEQADEDDEGNRTEPDGSRPDHPPDPCWAAQQNAEKCWESAAQTCNSGNAAACAAAEAQCAQLDEGAKFMCSF